ncbi:MAG: hypothetical protein LLG04_01120 [Parachlamydia sp.]|nr:hypothetical protein [Parachlamydia sp.]
MEKEGQNEKAKEWYERALHCYGYSPAFDKLKKLFPQEMDQFREIANASWTEHADSAYAFLHIDADTQLARRVTWLSQSAEMGSAYSKVDFDNLRNCSQAQEVDTQKMNSSYHLQHLEILLAKQAHPTTIGNIYRDLGQMEIAFEWYAKGARQGDTVAIFILEAAATLPPSIDLKAVKASYEKYWDEKAETTSKAEATTHEYFDIYQLVGALYFSKNHKHSQSLFSIAQKRGWTYIQDDLRKWGMLPGEAAVPAEKFLEQSPSP